MQQQKHEVGPAWGGFSTREDGGRTAKWLEIWLAFMSRDAFTSWKQQTLCGISVGSSVGHDPLLDEVRALLCLPGCWRASEASPPFPHQLYTPGSVHHIRFPKWHLPIASRSVEIVSICLFTWKPLTDSLSLSFYPLHTILSQNQWSLKCAPPKPSTLIMCESLLEM